MIMQDIINGQAVLVICFVCYGVWWHMAYHPGADEHTLSGKKGFWFALTAAVGIIGLFFIACGVHAAPQASDFSVREICQSGLVFYAVIATATYFLLKRPITAELALIIGWAGLELSVLQALATYGGLSVIGERILLFLLAVCTVIALIAYALYYKISAVSEKKAFYLGFLPLILAVVFMSAAIIAVAQYVLWPM